MAMADHRLYSVLAVAFMGVDSMAEDSMAEDSTGVDSMGAAEASMSATAVAVPDIPAIAKS